MQILRFIACILSLLLIAAHLLRWGGPPLAALPLLLVPLVFLRADWAGRVLQAALGLAALEWVRTAVVIAQERQAAGAPFLRMLLILAAVAATTALAAWMAAPRKRR